MKRSINRYLHSRTLSTMYFFIFLTGLACVGIVLGFYWCFWKLWLLIMALLPLTGPAWLINPSFLLFTMILGLIMFIKNYLKKD